MKKLCKSVLSGLMVLLMGSGIAWAAITAKSSPHGGIYITQKTSEAVLTLDHQKGQLKLVGYESYIAPESAWHSEPILIDNYIKLFGSGTSSLKNKIIPGILTGVATIDGKEMAISIPIQVNDPVLDGKGLLYRSVMTEMKNIPQNVELKNVVLVLYPPKVQHIHSICPFC